MKTNVWVQRGNAIIGEAEGDLSEFLVDISADNSIVVDESPLNSNNNVKDSGHVRVFQSSDQDQDQVQRGVDLDVEEINDFLRYLVALSKDGSIIVTGAYTNDDNEDNTGNFCMYHYSTTDQNWVQRGEDIDGEAVGDYSERLVDISTDGTIVTIESPDNGGDKNVGSLRVYKYNILDGLWVQRGADLDGEYPKDLLSADVSMLADGTVIKNNRYNIKKLKIMKWINYSSPPSSIPTTGTNVMFCSTATYFLRSVALYLLTNTHSPFLLFLFLFINSPFTPQCTEGETQLPINITTNRFPNQKTWDVQNISNETILGSDPCNHIFDFYSETNCSDPDYYRFTIQDSSSDGIF